MLPFWQCTACADHQRHTGSGSSESCRGPSADVSLWSYLRNERERNPHIGARLKSPSFQGTDKQCFARFGTIRFFQEAYDGHLSFTPKLSHMLLPPPFSRLHPFAAVSGPNRAKKEGMLQQVPGSFSMCCQEQISTSQGKKKSP